MIHVHFKSFQEIQPSFSGYDDKFLSIANTSPHFMDLVAEESLVEIADELMSNEIHQPDEPDYLFDIENGPGSRSNGVKPEVDSEPDDPCDTDPECDAQEFSDAVIYPQ